MNKASLVNFSTGEIIKVQQQIFYLGFITLPFTVLTCDQRGYWKLKYAVKYKELNEVLQYKICSLSRFTTFQFDRREIPPRTNKPKSGPATEPPNASDTCWRTSVDCCKTLTPIMHTYLYFSSEFAWGITHKFKIKLRCGLYHLANYYARFYKPYSE